MQSKLLHLLICSSAIITFLTGCLIDSQAKGGHVVENEVLAGTLYAENGTPAAGARVKVYSVDYLPNAGLIKTTADSGLVFTTRTDRKGRYKLDSLTPGIYNIAGEKDGAVSFLDSITIRSNADLVPNDTLKLPGSLTLFVAIEPNHPLRTVFAQVLGTEHFASADSTGKIQIAGIAQGHYSIRISTTLKDYAPYFGGAAIQSGRNNILKDTIRLVYTGIPAVNRIRAVYDTATGKVTVSWDPARYEFLQDYLIYRSKVSDLVPPLLPIGKTFEPSFIDSANSDDVMTVGGAPGIYEYRIRIRNKSDEIGPVFGSAVVEVAPRYLVKTALNFSLAGSQNFEVGIGDTTVLEAHWLNPTRRNSSIQWFTSEGAQISKLIPTSGNEGNEKLRIQAPKLPGPWNVVVIATDEAGSTWKDSVTLQVIQGAPIADAGADTTVSINDLILLHGIGTDSLGSVSKMEWNVGPGGAFVETKSGSSSATASVKPGNQSYIFRVTDDDGNISLDSVIVEVVLDAPIAMAGGDTTVSINDTVFVHDSSSDGLGTIVKREWDFGSKGHFVEVTSKKILTLASSVMGIEKHVLRVTDDDGNISYDTIKVTTINDFPRATLVVYDRIESQGGGYTLHATGSDLGKIVKWEWDIGETGVFVKGSTNDTGFLPTQAAGTALACKVRITDEDGNSAEARAIKFVSKWKIVGWPASPLHVNENRVTLTALDGKIYIAQNGSTNLIVYDPTANSWKEGPSFPPVAFPEYASAKIITLQGKLVLIYSGHLHGAQLESKIFVLEESLGGWLERYVDSYPSMGTVAAAVGGKLFVKEYEQAPLEEFDLEKGGYSLPGQQFGDSWTNPNMTTTREKLYIQADNLFSEYDPKSRIWRDIPRDNDWRHLGEPVGLDGKIYEINSDQTFFGFDIDTEKWESKSFIPYPEYGMGATVLNGKIYVMGRDGIIQSYDPKDEP